MGCRGSRGDTPLSAGWRGVGRAGKCVGGKEMPDEDSQLSAHRGQAGEEPRPWTGCCPHGATSGGLPATSCATGGPAEARCDGSGGRNPPHREEVVWDICVFFFSSPLWQPPPQFPPSHPSLMCNEKGKKPQRGLAGPNSHLGTVQHSPGLARHALIPQAPKSKQGESCLPFLPVAKG